MRHQPMKYRAIVLILAGIYLFGLLFGIWLISYLPSGAKRTNLTAMARGFAAQYTETGAVDPSPLSGRAAVIYTPDGRVADYFEADGYPIRFDVAAKGRDYAPKVLAGEESLRLILLAPNDTALGYTSLMYLGIPLVADGRITGALFWVQELRDLLEFLLAFVCTYTAVFAAVTVFVLLNLRTQRRYERLRRDYIDNITHELKTPIAAIKALAEALSDGMEKNPADRNVYYGMILREVNRQERMVCDALELSKLQSCHVPITRKPAEAAHVLGPVLEKYASLCDLMGIAFTVSEEVMGLPRLYTSETHLQTVLDALLGNAVKFVPEGGDIRVSAQTACRRVTLCVEDNGTGISREDLPHVFERFYKGRRGDNETGSGLGLAIAKEITDHMKERIRISSEEGVGTRVCLTVRLA